MNQNPRYAELLERVHSVEHLQAELEQTCREQQKSVNLLDAIRKAQSLYIIDADPKEIYDFLLQSLLDLTESEYGFLDEVVHDDAGRVYKINLAISNITWDAQSKELYRQLQDRDFLFAYLDNLSGLPALSGKVVISNHPDSDRRSKGLPEGHPEIRTFLGMPMYFGGELVCVAGVANREGGYTEEMPGFLEPLLSTCAGITFALQKAAAAQDNAEKLKQSEAQYRMIVEHQNDLVLQFDQEKRILYASPSYCKTFGFDEETIQGKTFFSLIHEDEIQQVKASIGTLTKPPYSTYHEGRAKTSGGWRWFGWSLKGVLDETGSIRKVIAVGRDITERKQTEAALQKSRQDFKTIADFTYDWEYWRAPDGHFIYVSPSCRRVTGYDPEDFLSDSGLMESIIHPEDRVLFAESKQKVDETKAIDFRIVTKAGEERWINHLCRPVYTEDGHFLGRRGSNRDITERKRLQDESMKAHQMEAISTLAGGVAHQFNNALSVIIGNVELLEEDFQEDPVVKKFAGEMKNAAERMTGLTGQLLAYARGGKYQATTVSLRVFLTEALTIIQHSLEPGITLDCALSDQELMVKIDKTQIQMTLTAVLVNASEAMDGRGRIRLTLGKVCVNHAVAQEQPELKPGHYACLSVTDKGRGMDQATQKRIFEPFFSTKFQGRGLGMAAAFGIIKNHEGAISVLSMPDKGSVVSIYLPLVEIAKENNGHI